MSKKRITVLGGCGYVGTPLTEALLAEGHQVRVFDIQWFGNHLPKHKNLEVHKTNILNLSAPDFAGSDVVIHLANVANDPCSELDPKLSWETNVLATMSLAEACIEANVEHFIFASSGSVYGIKDEERVTEDLSLKPISDYNKTKMIAERVLLSYGDKLSVSIIRPATVCGLSRRMRLDLTVNILTIQALTRKQITVFGGQQIRPHIHIKDLISVYQHFISEGPELAGIYNAGFENKSVLDVAKAIAQEIGAEIIVKEDATDPRSYRLCSDKLKETGFKPHYGYQEAIKELQEVFKLGELINSESCYNIKTMKKNMLAKDVATP